MQRILILIYIIAAAALAVYTSISQIQPSLFLIEFMAPNPGDKYSLTFVLIITMFIFLAPLAIYLLISRLLRMKATEEIDADRTGIFVTREKALQSGIIGIPIFINDNKAGIVDNGKTKFFDVPHGYFSIQAGKGKQASEILESKIGNKEQLHFEFVLKEAGLGVKIELRAL